MLRRSVQAVARLLRLTPDDTVFLEGGLGSQLMGMMIYRLRKGEDPATRCDVSYFFPEIQEPQTTAGATRWPWELHRYGMSLHDEEFVRSPRYRLRHDYLSQAALDEPYARLLAERDWNDLFPVLPEAVARANDLGLLDGSGYGAVHVRRGDYLKVSSRVVTLEESLAVATRLASLLPPRVLFLSDDEFTPEERSDVAARFPGRECVFLNEADQHIAHGLLRMAQVLVTSNSTFSWTAALLSARDGAIAVAPEHFFGSAMAPINNVFQGPASWMLISRSD